jgi:uncharacterized membrane protein
MRSRDLGLIVGLAAGLALAFGGFWAFLLVLVFGAVGLVIGRIVDGELDVSRYTGGGGPRRRGRP